MASSGYGGYGQPPWGGYGAPPPPPPRHGFGRTLAYLAVAVVAAGAGAGAAVALNNSNSSASSATSPFGGAPTAARRSTRTAGRALAAADRLGRQWQRQRRGNGNFGNGSTGTGGTNTGTGSLNASALAAKVDPGIVDITSQLKYSDATAEGTGIVISSSGLVLTNNHVIDEATSVSATLVVSGKTYTAKVLGYDSTDDVALLQLQGASGLKTASLGDSSKVKVGQAVLALGNAGGRGGLPVHRAGHHPGAEPDHPGQRQRRQHHREAARHDPDQRADPGGRLGRPARQRQRPGHRHGHRGQRLRLRP